MTQARVGKKKRNKSKIQFEHELWKEQIKTINEKQTSSGSIFPVDVSAPADETTMTLRTVRRFEKRFRA